MAKAKTEDATEQQPDPWDEIGLRMGCLHLAAETGHGLHSLQLAEQYLAWVKGTSYAELCVAAQPTSAQAPAAQ